MNHINSILKAESKSFAKKKNHKSTDKKTPTRQKQMQATRGSAQTLKYRGQVIPNGWNQKSSLMVHKPEPEISRQIWLEADLPVHCTTSELWTPASLWTYTAVSCGSLIIPRKSGNMKTGPLPVQIWENLLIAQSTKLSKASTSLWYTKKGN